MTAAVPQSKLTPEVIEAIEQSLRVNPSWPAAADYAGISERTLRVYRNRAEAHQTKLDHTADPAAIDTDLDRPYWEAFQRWQTARSRGEVELVAKIRQLGLEGDWRALHALAKMGWPERYSERVELTGAEGGPISVESKIAELLEEAGPRAEAALAEIAEKRKAAGIE